MGVRWWDRRRAETQSVDIPAEIVHQLELDGDPEEQWACGSGCGFVGRMDALMAHRATCKGFAARVRRLGIS